MAKGDVAASFSRPRRRQPLRPPAAVALLLVVVPSYLLLGTCTGILKKPKNGLFWDVLDGGGGSVRIKISARFARGGVQVHFILGVAVGSVRE